MGLSNGVSFSWPGNATVERMDVDRMRQSRCFDNRVFLNVVDLTID